MSKYTLKRILEYFIDNDPQLLIDFLTGDEMDLEKIDEDMRTDFEEELRIEKDYMVPDLCRQGAYELAYELADDDQTMEDVISEFISVAPVDALSCGIGEVEKRALEHIIDAAQDGTAQHGNKQSSRLIFEAYARLREGGYGDARYLWERSGVSIADLPHFGEIHQKAIETNDTYTMNVIAEELAESDDEAAAVEALALAYECRNYELQKEIEERLGMNDPTIIGYANLLDTAHTIIAIVEENFGIKLPQRVKVGGPTGSYAAIKYNKFGGKDVSRTAA